MNIEETVITKDLGNKRLHITRTFKAARPLVWSAWTEAELLDQWWAPRPFQTKTKSMDFREGGLWLYYMLSPEGDKHWCRLDYHRIVLQDYFTASDAFCDEHGIINKEHPGSHWKNVFIEENRKTKVMIEISFDSEKDLEQIIQMGFSEGFTMAHRNLDELLEKMSTK
jgi:uncharacterized protein YndB with AHSA1/START domain